MQYLLKKYNKNDFYFVNTFSNDCLFVVKAGNIFYDVFNHIEMRNAEFEYIKPLTDYITIDSDQISLLEAKKYCRPFIASFLQLCELKNDNDLLQ